MLAAFMAFIVIGSLAVLWILDGAFGIHIPDWSAGVGGVCMFVICIFGFGASLFNFVRQYPIDKRTSQSPGLESTWLKQRQ
jgi:hypothetical protein